MPHPNATLVQRMYDCLGKGDMDTLRTQIFAPDIQWDLPGRNPLGGVKHGIDEVFAFFAALGRSGLQVKNVRIDAIGDDRVVDSHVVEGSSGAASLRAMICTHYSIRGGKIVLVEDYLHNQHEMDLYFGAVYGLKPMPARLG